MKSLDHYWNSINLISILLSPLSFLFFIISRARKYIYNTGFVKSYTSPVPVIIIGNISVGGTGKTPLIIELVKMLQQRGLQAAVISRGYGGEAEQWPQIVNDQSTAKQTGDEPLLIYRQTRCPVVVGPNRKDDIELLLKQFNCDVILSDDGMQHYALQRDAEICVVDARKKFGNGMLLPAGPLRESMSRLQTVDLVLYNGGDKQHESFEMIPSKDVFIVGKRKQQESEQDMSMSLESFRGKTVHAVAGIGNPQRFFDMLKSCGVKVKPHAFKDHYYYQKKDLIFDDDLSVLMTEKDAVKCIHLDLQNHWSVPVDIVLSQSALIKLNGVFDSVLKSNEKSNEYKTN